MEVAVDFIAKTQLPLSSDRVCQESCCCSIFFALIGYGMVSHHRQAFLCMTVGASCTLVAEEVGVRGAGFARRFFAVLLVFFVQLV
jgi:hypothetical protein